MRKCLKILRHKYKLYGSQHLCGYTAIEKLQCFKSISFISFNNFKIFNAP